MLPRRALIYQKLVTALSLLGFGYLLTRASMEFYQIAWGTGVWLGEFSLKWGLGFAAFVLFCALSWGVVVLATWQGARFEGMTARLVSIRAKTGALRMVFAIILLIFPVWLLQYTPWGVVFSGQHLRWLLWGMVVLGMTFAFSGGRELWSWQALLTSLLLTSAAFSIAFALINVTNFPFSLGWSEGNRMWDYSMMFGRGLYLIPPDEEVFVLLDVGRQFIGGIPFLFPGVSILAERLWVGLTGILPYLFLGLAVFRQEFKRQPLWWSLGLFTFIFLKQGPIHPPLVVCAIAVALVWRSPLWVGIPLIFLTGYFAQESRFTWLFAPAIWIVLLEFCGNGLEKERVPVAAWWRAGSLGVAGAVGGYVGNALVGWVRMLLSGGVPTPLAGVPSVNVSAVAGSVMAQPLLWYRLFPNATYGSGILLGLFLAIFPLTVLLIYLSFSGRWRMNTIQKLTLVTALIAFLVVGLIVSTKIGGGGDLHNLDMFLIGLFFTAVIAWQCGGNTWFKEVQTSPGWVKGALVLLFVIPGLYPLASLRSFSFAEDTPWLVTLTDVSDSRFIGMLPPQADVDNILGTIRHEVEASKSQGEILFMDQRQLLTFGYVKEVPFVPEYEKKVLMNQAMSANSGYFSAFYEDLADRRFSLIVSEPLRAPIKDSTYQFGEENNAWVKWVVEPVLCYYEPVETYRSVQIQLLVPKQGNLDCASQLPISNEP